MNDFALTPWTPSAPITHRIIKDETIMNEVIENTIGKRAQNARTKRELVDAIFASFVEHEVDPNEVSLEDMKAAVVVACRSARRSSESLDTSCLA